MPRSTTYLCNALSTLTTPPSPSMVTSWKCGTPLGHWIRDDAERALALNVRATQHRDDVRNRRRPANDRPVRAVVNAHDLRAMGTLERGDPLHGVGSSQATT